MKNKKPTQEELEKKVSELEKSIGEYNDKIAFQDDEKQKLLIELKNLHKENRTLTKLIKELQKSSEESYRTLVENINDVHFSLDINGRFTYISPVIERFSSYKVDEILGQSFTKFVHPDDLPELLANFAKTLEGSGESYEFRIHTKDGMELFVRTSSRPLREEGQLIGLTGIMVDITKRKLAETELKRANEQLAALYKVGQAITAPLDLKVVLEVIARNTAKLLESDTGVILLVDESGETLTIKEAFGLGKEVIEGTRDRIGESIAGRVVLTGQPIIANDLPNDPRFYNPSAEKEGLLACASVPLVVGGKIIGTLDIHSKTNRQAFNEEHIQVLNMLASQAAIAIENARLYEQIQQARDELEIRVQQRTAELVATNAQLQQGITELKHADMKIVLMNRALRMLSDSNQALIRISDESKLLNEVCRIIIEVGGYRMVWVGFTENGEAETLRPVAHSGIDSYFIETDWLCSGENERGRCPAGEAIRTCQPYLVRNISSEPDFTLWRETALQHGFRSLIEMPLINEDHTLGSLGIYSSEIDAFNDKEIEILKELAGDLAFGVTTLRIQAMKKQAEEALRESEERFRLIAENTADTIYVFDMDLNAVYISPSILKLRGYTVQEAMTQSFDQILTPESLQKVDKLLAEQTELEATGNADPFRTETIELEEYCKDGSVIYVEVAISIIRDVNLKPTQILTVTRDISERKRTEKVQEAIYRIPQSVFASESMQELYSSIHCILRELMPVENFYIALYDSLNDIISFPYFVDQYDKTPASRKSGNGLTEYVLRTGCPLLAPPEVVANLVKQGEVELIGMDSIDWLGVPLKVEDKVIGVLVTQTYSEKVRLSQADSDLLTFVSTQMVQAIEHKRAEEQLRLLADLQSAILNNAAYIVISTDRNGLITTYNPAAEHALGYTAEECIGKLIPVIFHDPDELAERAGMFSAELGTPVKPDFEVFSAKAQRNLPNEYEWTYISKNGSRFMVLLSVTSLYDLQGNITGFLGIANDITKRKWAEEALQDNEQKLKTIVYGTPIPQFVIDRDHMVIYWNKALEEMTGIKAEEVIGTARQWIAFYPAERPCLADLLVDGTIDAIPEWYGEKYMRSKYSADAYESIIFLPTMGKEGKWLDFTAVVIRDTKGNVIGAVETLVDITLSQQTEVELNKLNAELTRQNEIYQTLNKELLRAKEKAEESDRLKTAFLCNMSHEIRTPMNAIIGFSDLLFSSDVPMDEKRTFPKLIKERSYDLLRIIEDILDISKIEVGQMQIIVSDVDLGYVLYELYGYYKLKISQLETEQILSINYSMDDGLKNIILKTDGQRLKQILNNLLDNALKFTKKGSIEFGCKIDSASELLFFVKDTGIGIPSDSQEIIFDRFRQAEDLVLNRTFGGTGLGLSIVKGLVTLMNGKVWLESKVDSGTTFYFTLPFKLSEKNKESNSLSTGESYKSASWWNKIILVVEDDQTSAEYLKRLISGKGLQVLMAYSGEEALQVFKNNPDIDLILMDIRLPDTNGLKITRKIKDINPEIIIIAQTAYAYSNDIQDCIDAGCDDYISKPINSQKLISLIDQYLKLNKKK